MCCCGKPTVNGEQGYRWNNPNADAEVYPVNAPELQENEKLIYDEPGRCGGLDSHSYHYRVVQKYGSFWLLVRHGGGDERLRLSCDTTLRDPLTAMDSTARYWILNAIYHAHSYAKREAQELETSRWKMAAAQGRIKTRKQRNADSVKVWIEPISA